MTLSPLRNKLITLAVAMLGVIAAPAGKAAAPDITVKATLDSATLEMGRVTALHVEVFGTIDAADSTATAVALELPDSMKSVIEVAGITEPEVTDLGNGRARILRDIIIQSFDSGLYTLPPVVYFADDSTFRSNETILKVYPVAVDSLTTINDYADVVAPNRQLLDYLPDWIVKWGWWVLLAIVVIAAVVYIYIRKRKGVAIIPAAPVKKEDPVDAALRQLGELREEKLCQRGEEKTYYTRLTDILRIYLHDRFGINAMEMTSTQIRHALRSHDATRMSTDLMGRILEMADFVKFAKVRPLPDDNIAVMNEAVKFVDDTRPVVVPEAPATDGETKPSDSDKSTPKVTKP